MMRKLKSIFAVGLWIGPLSSTNSVDILNRQGANAELRQLAPHRKISSIQEKKIKLVLSVDWEGDAITQQNVNSIEKFRTQFPEVKLVHFLNAAYFLKAKNENQLEFVRNNMKNALKKDDQLGLHIHAWRSLVNAAGVEFRPVPSFWHDNLDNGDSDSDIFDQGHDVFLGAYQTEEIRKMIQVSLRTLSKNGFETEGIFRTGGWYLSDSVRNAIAAEGFKGDSSAVPPNLLQNEINATPLYRELSKLWSDITILTTSFDIQTPYGVLREYPNNTALADYQTGEEAFEIFQKIIEGSQSEEVILHYGFHHETAGRFLPRVTKSILLLQKYVAENDFLLEFDTLH